MSLIYPITLCERTTYLHRGWVHGKHIGPGSEAYAAITTSYRHQTRVWECYDWHCSSKLLLPISLPLLQYIGHSTEKWKTPADQYMSQRADRRSRVSMPMQFQHHPQDPKQGSVLQTRIHLASRASLHTPNRLMSPPVQMCNAHVQATDGAVMSGSTSPQSMSSHALSPFSSSPRLSSGGCARGSASNGIPPACRPEWRQSVGQPEEAMCAHGPIVIDSSILTLTMMEWPDAGGAGHMQVSSTAGSIPRINSTSEVRHLAQPSADIEGMHISSCLPV